MHWWRGAFFFLDFTGFAGLHPIRLLDLKRQNTYMDAYRGGIFGVKIELKHWQG